MFGQNIGFLERRPLQPIYVTVRLYRGCDLDLHGAGESPGIDGQGALQEGGRKLNGISPAGPNGCRTEIFEDGVGGWAKKSHDFADCKTFVPFSAQRNLSPHEP
jgi:hypothetical protein